MIDLLFLIGAGLVVAGVALVSVPGGLVVAGVIAALLAVALERGKRSPGDGS